MINVKVALHTWKDKWTNKRINIFCDNKAVVDICNTGKTKDKCLGAILREIQMIRARYNINLQLLHVYGHLNTQADALSRVHMNKCNECVMELLKQSYKQKRIKRTWMLVNNEW